MRGYVLVLQLNEATEIYNRALQLCSDNLEMLKEGAEKYYAAQ